MLKKILAQLVCIVIFYKTANAQIKHICTSFIGTPTQDAEFVNLGKVLQKFSPIDTSNCFEGGSLYIDILVHSNSTLSNFTLNKTSTVNCTTYTEALINILKPTSGKWIPAFVNKNKVCTYKKVGFSCLLPADE